MNSSSILTTNTFNLDASGSTLLKTCLLITCVALIAATLPPRPSDNKVHELGGLRIITAWTFFTKRYEFLRQHFETVGRKIFRFRVLQHRVIAVSGEDYRKIFFSETGLSLTEGYRMLMGSSPSLENIGKREERYAAMPDFIKRLLRLVRRDRVAEILPTLLEDINRRMKGWGTEGTIDPFNEVYDLVFQMVVRMATCRELSEDAESIQKLMRHYLDIEQNATPIAVLLPWFPGLAKRKRKQATLGLYNHLKPYLDLRRKAKTPTFDAFDILMAEGASDDTIIGTVIGIIFAAVVNTGVNSCWALINLGANHIWKQKATDELKAFLNRHTDPNSPDLLYKRLSTIPLNAWEDELPCLDLITRETLRLTMSVVALRRNLGKDITFGESIVKHGEFVIYPLGDVHLNPDLYTDPEKFDPDRYREGREEDKKETLAYLAWGAGRHPCTGIKVAKLQMKLILAMVLLGYEYELVDGSGKFPKTQPQPDRNEIQQVKPLGGPCYLKFKRTVK